MRVTMLLGAIIALTNPMDAHAFEGGCRLEVVGQGQGARMIEATFVPSVPLEAKYRLTLERWSGTNRATSMQGGRFQVDRSQLDRPILLANVGISTAGNDKMHIQLRVSTLNDELICSGDTVMED